MTNAMPSETQINAFVDAGSTPLPDYVFASEALNTRRAANLRTPAVASGEPSVECKLNQTGNIFYATTSKELGQDAKDLFGSVTVLFAAMTKALADKKKD